MPLDYIVMDEGVMNDKKRVMQVKGYETKVKKL